MDSVNVNGRTALPPVTAETTTPQPAGADGWGFTDGLTAMATSTGSVLTDAATFVGAETHDDGSIKAGVDPLGLAGFGATVSAPTMAMALRNRVNAHTGVETKYLDRLGAQAASNSIRVTPTLVSAIAGPAIADGITMIAPNLVGKYKDPKTISNAEEKKKQEKTNQNAKWQRAAAGGVAVGLAAGAVFLLKPELFKRFQMTEAGRGLVDRAINGTTHFTLDGGKPTKLAGVLDATQIRGAMASLGKPVAEEATVNVLKTVAPMARDASFTNSTMLASAGGLGTLLLANKAAGEEDPGQQKLMWGLTAAAGALSVGGAAGIGKLTQRSIAANGGTGGILAKNDLLMKPNIEWIKKYASTIAPITAIPAGTSASQYFNIVDDFEDITAPRSPFRK